MTIKGFDEKNGDYLIVRYVVYWKSGKYFHKRVCFEKGKYENNNNHFNDIDNFYTIMSDGVLNWQLKNFHHNLEVIAQFKNLEELNKVFQLCKNYNEY
jgi:hypothetical protein|nr:MAG TPA: hypothetical protein [Caudoviricetes sp.]